MKIAVFGTGKFYQVKRDFLLSNAELIVFLDNNREMQGKYLEGKPVICPNNIRQFSFDKILLMSIRAVEMKKQLLEIGIEEEYIWYWEQFSSHILHGTFKLYCGNKNEFGDKKRILVISTALDYNGGSLAAVYALLELQKKKYFVILMVPGGNELFINEILEWGINIVVCPTLPYLYQEEIFFVKQFDIVIVNVFQMIFCACEISKIRPTMWWVHESKELYRETLFRFSECANWNKMEKINIYAVSKVAQNNFNEYFPNRIKKTLCYGIPDKNGQQIMEIGEKLVFAIVGNVCPLKGQDIFVQAVNWLSYDEKQNVEFWIIGNIEEDNYGMKIREQSLEESTIKVLGRLNRKEINLAYEKINVIICSSREETMSIAITEAMMYGKVCIVSDSAGISDYITEGENGFVFKTGDILELSDKIKFIIHNKEKLRGIGANARRTYETFFNLESFGKRLVEALNDTMSK